MQVDIVAQLQCDVDCWVVFLHEVHRWDDIRRNRKRKRKRKRKKKNNDAVNTDEKGIESKKVQEELVKRRD